MVKQKDRIELAGIRMSGQMVVTPTIRAALISAQHVDTSEPATETTDEPRSLALHGRCTGTLCANL